jgi:hypothetical protein
MLHGMANEELSEDCKQRLRDLDQGIAQVIACLAVNDIERTAYLSRQLLPLLDQPSSPDERCKKALRAIDQASSVLSFAAQLVRSASGGPPLMGELEQWRERIQTILFLGKEPE